MGADDDRWHTFAASRTLAADGSHRTPPASEAAPACRDGPVSQLAGYASRHSAAPLPTMPLVSPAPITPGAQRPTPLWRTPREMLMFAGNPGDDPVMQGGSSLVDAPLLLHDVPCPDRSRAVSDPHRRVEVHRKELPDGGKAAVEPWE